MRSCDLCLTETPGEVGTPFIDGQAFVVCREHFNLFVRTTEDIGLWAWCRRILTPTEIGVSVLCDWIDSMVVGE